MTRILGPAERREQEAHGLYGQSYSDLASFASALENDFTDLPQVAIADLHAIYKDRHTDYLSLRQHLCKLVDNWVENELMKMDEAGDFQ